MSTYALPSNLMSSSSGSSRVTTTSLSSSTGRSEICHFTETQTIVNSHPSIFDPLVSRNRDYSMDNTFGMNTTPWSQKDTMDYSNTSDWNMEHDIDQQFFVDQMPRHCPERNNNAPPGFAKLDTTTNNTQLHERFSTLRQPNQNTQQQQNFPNKWQSQNQTLFPNATQHHCNTPQYNCSKKHYVQTRKQTDTVPPRFRHAQNDENNADMANHVPRLFGTTIVHDPKAYNSCPPSCGTPFGSQLNMYQIQEEFQIVKRRNDELGLYFTYSLKPETETKFRMPPCKPRALILVSFPVTLINNGESTEVDRYSMFQTSIETMEDHKNLLNLPPETKVLMRMDRGEEIGVLKRIYGIPPESLSEQQIPFRKVIKTLSCIEYTTSVLGKKGIQNEGLKLAMQVIDQDANAKAMYYTTPGSKVGMEIQQDKATVYLYTQNEARFRKNHFDHFRNELLTIMRTTGLISKKNPYFVSHCKALQKKIVWDTIAPIGYQRDRHTIDNASVRNKCRQQRIGRMR